MLTLPCAEFSYEHMEVGKRKEQNQKRACMHMCALNESKGRGLLLWGRVVAQLLHTCFSPWYLQIKSLWWKVM